MKHLLQKRCQTATMFFSKQECLKKGHAHFCADLCDSPQNGKPCFPETRNPVWGTSHQMISAKRGMQQSPKWQTMFPGNKKPRFRDIRMCKSRRRQSPKRQKLFSGNETPPQKGTCARAVSTFWHRPSQIGFKGGAHTPLPYMLSRQWLRKSSANYLVPRGFAQKGFAISILGHFFCPFPDNFIESCRVKTKNNKIKIQYLL